MTASYQTYDKYKDSGVEWLGNIPEKWVIEKGKWLFLKKDRPVRINDDVVTAFRDGEVTLRSNRRKDGFTNAIQEHGYQGIRKGDLVIHAMDAFAGAIGVSDSDGKSTPVYSACVPRGEYCINSLYYGYLLRYVALSGFILSLAKGIRERSTDFRFNDFGKMLLPVPKQSEQIQISTFLDKKTKEIDTAIAKKQRLIDLLKEQKAILINQAVTKGLNPNVPMKDSGVEWIGEIPAHWELKKLKQLTSKIGSGITPSGGGTTYLDEGIPLLRSQNIHFNKISLTDVARISRKVHESMANSKVKAGDVLLNITGGSIGRCFYVSLHNEMNVNQHVCIIRPTIEIETIFLNSLLFSEVGQSQIWFFQQGGGREGLNFKALKNFHIPLPPRTEQIEIEKFCTNISNKIEKVIDLEIQTIQKLKEYKQTLIAYAVTGKIKV